MKRIPTFKALLLVAATLALSLGPAADPADGRDSIRLRVNDAQAEPGGLVAVVIRTYAPRPISQGQISVRAKRKKRKKRLAAESISRGAPPPLTLESYKVFSQRGDAKVTVDVSTQGGSQTVKLQFSSKSGSINRVDGPLAVLYFRLSETAKPRQEYELSIDVPQTAVVSPKGKLITFVPRAGVLRVRKPEAGHELEIEGDIVAPGDVAQVELQTIEPVAMSGGHIEIEYDPSITADLPSVTMNKKYGRRKFDVDVSTSGRIKVDFRSKDASWNLVPGGILTIAVPTSRAAASGTKSPFTVDDSATELLDGDGVPLIYSFKGGSVNFKGTASDDDDDSDDDNGGNTGPLSMRVRPDRWRAEWSTGSNSGSGGSTLEARVKNGPWATVSPGTVQLTGPAGTILPVSTRFTDSSFRAEFNKKAALGLLSDLTDGGNATVTLSGSLSDGTAWSLTSTVNIRNDGSDDDGNDDDGDDSDDDDGDDSDDDAAEFEGNVSSVNTAAGTLTLAGGQVITINSATTWDATGDLFTLAGIEASLAAGNTVSVEGSADVQADGATLATSIKAEDNSSDDDSDDDDSDDDDAAEFTGNVASVDTGASTLTLAGGQVITINSATAWDASGDLFTLAEIEASLAAGNTISVEGNADVQADGTTLATSIKAEDNSSDDDSDDDDAAEFEGNVASVDTGASTLTLAGGQVITINGATAWDASGDLFTLAEVEASLAAGNTVTVEGSADVQADGTTLATSIKAEDNSSGDSNNNDDDDGDDDDADATEFEDTVSAVDEVAGTITLSGGQVVAVNTATVWDASGDLTSLADIASALATGTTVDAEGEGQTQADGSILATEIKVETDD